MLSFLRAWRRRARGIGPARPATDPAPRTDEAAGGAHPAAPARSLALTPVHGVRADLRTARWDDEGFTVEGWLTVGGRKRHPPRALSVWAVALDAPEAGDAASDETADGPGLRSRTVRLLTSEPGSLDVNGFVTSAHDLTSATFAATLTWEAWEQLGGAALQIVLRYGAAEAEDGWSPLTHRYRWGSAGHLAAQISSGHRYAPQWDADRGIVVRRSAPAAFTRGAPTVRLDTIRIPLDLADGFDPVTADWTEDTSRCTAPLAVHRGEGADAEVVVTAYGLPRTAGAWGISLADARGTRRLIHWGDETWDAVPLTDSASLQRRPGGVLRLVVSPAPQVRAHDVSPTEEGVLVTVSPAPRAAALLLRGARATLRAVDDGGGRHRFPLVHASWRGTVAAPPAGGYRLWAEAADGTEVPVRPSPGLSRRTPEHARSATASFRIEHAPDDQVYVHIGAPLRDAEKGRFNSRRLAALHTGDPDPDRGEPRPDIGGVFLESWYGKTFSDNPAPLVDALRAAGVPGPYRVAVADWSVEHPPDVEALIVGSESYWRALGTSRIIVVNTWLPTGFTKRQGQYVVQTWHGTPLKSLGMDVPHRVGSAAAAENLRRGSQDWDLLVSQSPYATEILRRAYVFDGEVAETGYPRNDILSGPGAAEARARTRRALGVPEAGALVLYAPTWREQDKGRAGPLDTAELSALLPTDHVVAVRGHSVTLRRGADVTGDRIIDVTSYPEPAELMAAADVLVTDYSSIMFDFSATGRPIVFHTPDYAEYLSEGRGGYFDLAAHAPGPLTSTTAELADALLDARTTDAPGTRYRAWQQRFVPHDDGRAAARLARRIADAAPHPDGP